jgi:hypothetical protein
MRRFTQETALQRICARCVALLYALLSTMFFAVKVHAMPVLQAGEACVFSEVTGVVLLDGKPAAGATVRRHFEYRDKRSDETMTNDEGRFALPALHERSLARLLPAEFVVAQAIIVEYQGQQYRIWSNTKRRPEPDSELGDRPLRLRCELSAPLTVHRQFGSILRTSCVWE